MKASNYKYNKTIRIWLLIGLLMLIGQVILGGITRLTGSGLSITSWDIVTGVVPPLNDEEWLQAFEAYKETPQFHKINSTFNVKDFKFIYFWEYFHRLWVRALGFIFLIKSFTIYVTPNLKMISFLGIKFKIIENGNINYDAESLASIFPDVTLEDTNYISTLSDSDVLNYLNESETIKLAKEILDEKFSDNIRLMISPCNLYLNQVNQIMNKTRRNINQCRKF